MLELGDWLRANSAAIQGTRGGPWKFSTWGGSTHRGTLAFLHVLTWKGETLRLPSIPNRRVVSARVLSGDALSFKPSATEVEIMVPKALRRPTDTIIELTMDQSLDNLKPL